MSFISESPLRDALYGGAIDRADRQAIKEAFSRRRTMFCEPAYAPASTIIDDFYQNEEEKRCIESMFC